MNISFILRQHTPLIHFQHNQEGATLRATELKPKLDRFLKEHYFESREKYQHLLIPKSRSDALDYKIYIEGAENNLKSELPSLRNTSTKFPNYFANLGGDNTKDFVWTNDAIRVTIFSFHTVLLQAIKKSMPTFLMRNNFGMRQSKGFGAFYLDATDFSYQPPKLEYAFDVPTSSIETVFKHIELFYRSMRSGINLIGAGGRNVFYFKSLLFLYAKAQGWQWDKKTIKESYFNDVLQNQKRNYGNADILHYQSQDKKLVKDLFGLSLSESWGNKVTISKQSNSGEVERFKSPIIFKPIQINSALYRVFFGIDNYPREILNQEFIIKNNGRGDLRISTPESFSFASFFDFIFDTRNFEIHEHVAPEFYGRYEFKILQNIYSQLQR